MKTFHVLLALASAATALAADFTRDEVSGWRLALVDDERIEGYVLGRGGVALVEIGRKGGPITAPAWRWRIEEGRLVIADGDDVKERFELIERREKTIKLRRLSGEVVEFQISATNE